MQYRPFRPEDFTALYAIEEVCFPPPERFRRRYMRRLVESRKAATWISEAGGRMVGFAVVNWVRGAEGIEAYIQTIEVLPESRGCGAGGELLERVEESARAADAARIGLHVEASNGAAIRLYEARGYVCKGRQEDYYGRERAALIYGKILSAGGQ